MRTTLDADAEPGLTFYYGVVVERREGYPTGCIVANCQHHHRTRESAERCGEKILRGIKG